MISELKLNNFRCFETSIINLSPGINFFYGPNGSGKTSILEAIYMCSSGKSFKSSNIKSLISFDQDFFSINAYDSNKGYTLNLVKGRTSPISIKINNTKKYGAKIIFYDPSKETREQIGEDIALKENRKLIKPYDDYDIIAGQGTAGYEIFQDLELSFDALEFKSILYTVMSSNKYKLETVFFLLFGGQGELFKDKKQHEVFYGNLREILFKICEELKTKESALISGLREQCVDIKMSLIGIMRFLEDQDVGLKDLPAEILNQIIELDQFCNDSLPRFSICNEPPDLKFIRDLKVALKVVAPQLTMLEEEIYSQIAIY